VPKDTNWSDWETVYKNGLVASREHNERLMNASILALLDVPSTAPPSHSHYLLRALLREDDIVSERARAEDREAIVDIQALQAFPPSYTGIVPWPSWLSGKFTRSNFFSV